MKTNIFITVLVVIFLIVGLASCTKKMDSQKCGVIISDSSYLFAGKWYFDVKVGSDTQRVQTRMKETYNHGNYCW